MRNFFLALLISSGFLFSFGCGSNDKTGPGPTPTPTSTPGHGFDTKWGPLGTSLNGIAVHGNTVYVADGSSPGTIWSSNLSGGSTAVFVGPGGFGLISVWDVAVDAAGNVYATDFVSEVKKYNSSGTYLGTFGTVSTGSDTTHLNSPRGIDVDSDGNVYIADWSNNRIVKLDSSLSFSATFTSAYSVNFSKPYSVKVSGTNIYVLDSFNDRVVEMTNTGTAVTQWGTSGSGNGQFNNPDFLGIDHNNGNIYVADAANNQRIQLFTSSGAYLSQWGGLGTGDSQFGGTTLTYNSPRGIAVDTSGKVYVVDQPAASGTGLIKVFGP